MGTKYLNFTPHPISICDNTGKIYLVIDPEGPVARVEYRVVDVPHEGSIPLVDITLQGTIDLPDPMPDTLFIVSGLVASMVRRPDVVAPETNFGAVRDPAGKVIAVRRLRRFA